MGRRTGVFLKEFVVLFGFLNGVWLAVGVNPAAELLEVVVGVLASLLGSEGVVGWLLTSLPLVLVLGAFILIHRRGGVLGLLAVGVAVLAGLLVTSAPSASLILLLAAAGLGYVATR